MSEEDLETKSGLMENEAVKITQFYNLLTSLAWATHSFSVFRASAKFSGRPIGCLRCYYSDLLLLVIREAIA